MQTPQGKILHPKTPEFKINHWKRTHFKCATLDALGLYALGSGEVETMAVRFAR